MTRPARRTGRLARLARLLAVALVVAAAAGPPPCRAVTPNRSVAAAVLGEPRARRGGLRLTAAAWLEGGWEATASLAWRTAARTGDRGADGLTPAVGLRWAPDRPGWRPEAAVEIGCRWPAGAWRAAAPEGLVRGGLEWLPTRTAGLGLAAGIRWGDGAAPALELAATGRLYF